MDIFGTTENEKNTNINNDTAVAKPEENAVGAEPTVDNSQDAKPEESTSAGKTNEEEHQEIKKFFSMPDGAVSENEIVDKDFWQGITLPEVDARPKKRKGAAKRLMFSAVMSIVFIAAGFGIACVSARGRGVLSNLVTGGRTMTFSLPVSDRPSLANTDMKDQDGRYSAEGIAEVCGPSVVSLDIYGDKSDFIPIGQGSGIIMSTDGYIVSNAHVVDKGTKAIKAILSDGSEYAAEVIGSDPRTDIAVIKIPATGLTAAEFGDSDSVRLGEEIVVIGCPAGYRQSVTKGIVSGLDRKIMAENSAALINCLQVDAAINPGNSGGPLFNMWGQVIGITSSKLASVDYEGIGFAIATNEAKDIIEQLMEFGKVTGRARVGLTFYYVSDITAEMTGVKAGARVSTIDPECDVAHTDLREGDIITSFEGIELSEIDDLPAMVRERKPGDEVTCHIYRPAEDEDSDPYEFDITFKLMEDNGTLTLNN